MRAKGGLAEHHLKKYLYPILAGNGDLSDATGRYKAAVTYPTCRQLMAEIVVEELIGLAEIASSLEMSPEVLKEFAHANRAFLNFLGETGAGGIQDGLLEYCTAIKKAPGFGDLWVLACRTAGQCRVRELSANPSY